MKIAICLRRVPDTTAKIAIASNGTSIDETGVKFVPNPYDEYALEAGIALRDAAGAGETVVIAFGGDAVQETMRTALAMGVDRACTCRGRRRPTASPTRACSPTTCGTAATT
ncbi:MAG: hypothetical protein IPJ11_02495 [Gemmatimonadetes bacterium]|nr:hypothetical protein [Gemmatimonadota bacterium]